MYATGMRVSEVARLRFRDLDFDRSLINIWQGKGRTDRQAMLPRTFEELLKSQAKLHSGDDYLFPTEISSRGQRNVQPQFQSQSHLSPRTISRVMARAMSIASIDKRATPHSLRHSFATHAFESGSDIRRIQKVLGHVHIETTTIYVKVAQPIKGHQVPSPLDNLNSKDAKPSAPQSFDLSRSAKGSPQAGNLAIHLKEDNTSEQAIPQVKVTLEICNGDRPVFFTGIIAKQVRADWITLEIPPLDAWRKEMSWLTPPQRTRFQQAEFFAMLQREIPKRIQLLRSKKQ